ncbi:MAG: DUF998 domain-containing protein [Longimicrobiales bacterium]
MESTSATRIAIEDVSGRPDHPERLARLGALAISGQAVLLASAWFLPLASEYELVGDHISELVLGRFGVVQTIAFLVAGAGTIALAVAIRSLTAGARGSLFGSLLIAIYGTGAILIAFFPTDRIDSQADVAALSTTGTIHVLVSLVSFVAVVIGMFVLTWTFARTARWRTSVRWSSLLAGAALALFFVQNQGPWVGLMQRLMVTAIACWLILAAFRVRSIAAAGVGEVG